MFVDPLPEGVHKGAPGEEEEEVDDVGDGGGVRVAGDVEMLFEVGNVGVVVGAGAEVQVGGEAGATDHNDDGDDENSHGDERRGYLVYTFALGRHYLNRSSTGTWKTTPLRRNQTANSVKAMLNTWPTM